MAGQPPNWKGVQPSGCDLDQPHLVVAAAPPQIVSSERFGGRSSARSSIAETIPYELSSSSRRIGTRSSSVCAGPAAGELAGLGSGSRPRVQGQAAFAAGFEEAQQALLGGRSSPGTGARVVAYDELGACRYLLRVPVEEGLRDPHRDAATRLAEYDRSAGAPLVAPRGVPAGDGDSVTFGGALRPPEHAPPRLRRIVELPPRPPARRLARDRDRGQAMVKLSRRRRAG